jgi:hypothetical protein
MELELKDKDGQSLRLGDMVRVLKLTDDSGNATDLYGVEPQLNGWVDILYIEPFEGIITFDHKKLMVVIKGKCNNLPLSDFIRYNIWNDIYDRLSKEDLEIAKEEFGLENTDYETIIDYLVKL